MIEDRPYQKLAIERLRQGFRDSHRRQVLSASTGAGKSVIMLQMIQSAIEKGSKVLFICERRVLVDQFSKHLDSSGIDHGVIMAKHWRYRPDAQVQVATAQTLEKMETWPKFDICFVDEIHACLRASLKTLMRARPDLRVVGATATPFNPALGHYFSAVTSVITMKELVDQGFLVPYRVFVATEIDTKDVKVVAGEWQKDELEKRGQQIVGDVVADYIRISNEVFGEYRKTICFSCGIAHGADLAEKFNEAGINAVQISSNDEDDYRAQVLADFAKPDSDIKVVISVAILSRGFDQTDVEHVILARPLKKSFSEHVQMLGRGARTHPGKGFAVIQDNSGNWLRFRDSWDDFYANGVDRLGAGPDKKSRKEPTDQEKEAAKCPKCSHLWPSGTDTCPQCGFIRARRNDVVNVAGEMREITPGEKPEKYSAEVKEDWYAQLLGYCDESKASAKRANHHGPQLGKESPDCLAESESSMNDLQKAEAALRFISSDERDVWVSMGMALQSSFGDAGKDIWMDWSRESRSFNELSARSVWRSFKGTGITLGTLLHEARQNGWRDIAPSTRPTPEQLAAQRQAVEERASRDGLARDAYLHAKGFADMQTLVWRPSEDVNLMCIPMFIGKQLVGVQMIDKHGEKKYLSGQVTSKAEHCFDSGAGCTQDQEPHPRHVQRWQSQADGAQRDRDSRQRQERRW